MLTHEREHDLYLLAAFALALAGLLLIVLAVALCYRRSPRLRHRMDGCTRHLDVARAA